MAKFIKIRPQGLSDSVTIERGFYINIEMGTPRSEPEKSGL